MARQDRPVVGTMQCETCNSQATLHETARGTRKALLYVRCPECGCDQRTGAKIQAHWRQTMTARPGYEHLTEPKPEPVEQPEEPQRRAVPEKPEPTGTKPKTATEPEPKGQKMRSPAGAVLFALGLAIITMGAIK